MDNYKIIKFVNDDFEMDIIADKENETVWLSEEEIAKAFCEEETIIDKYIKSIFNNKELEENESIIFFNDDINHISKKYYNLDVILAVSYKVNSKKGIIFRRFIKKVLKEYLIYGYSIKEKRMASLNKTIEVQNKMLASFNTDDNVLTNVVNEYTKALDLLDDYDHSAIKKPEGNQTIYKLQYDESRKIIDSMKFNSLSSVFGVEKEEGKLKGILDGIYQNVFGKELYPSLEEKAAHLLYFLVKDHPFVDGCKRIASVLFLEFLNKNHALFKNGNLIITNGSLVAITILTAESKPEEMDVIIKLIMNLLIDFR